MCINIEIDTRKWLKQSTTLLVNTNTSTNKVSCALDGGYKDTKCKKKNPNKNISFSTVGQQKKNKKTQLSMSKHKINTKLKPVSFT